MQSWVILQKTAKNEIQKIREIDEPYLCLQRFDKFWMWSSGNRKRKLYEFEETSISWNHLGQTYVLAGFRHLQPLWDAKKEKKHCSSINWGISSNFFDSYCETELNVSGLDENSLVGRTKVFIDIRGSLQIQPTCCLVSKRHLNPFFNRTWDLFRTSRVVRWRKSFRRWLYRQFLFLPPSVFLLSRPIIWSILQLKYGFCNKSSQKDEPLTSWTLFSTYLSSLLVCKPTHPKVMTNTRSIWL